MIAMFYNSNFDGDISQWNVSKVKDMKEMVAKSPLIEKYGENGKKLKK